MDELPDYKIASGYHDVRDWEVKDVHHKSIGKVDNLLVDINTSRVVYLDVEVNGDIIDDDHDLYRVNSRKDIHEFINTKGDNHLLIPVGLVALHPDQGYVQSNSVDFRFFADSGRIKKGTPINREYELLVVDSYGKGKRSKTITDGDDFYGSEEFDDKGFRK